MYINGLKERREQVMKKRPIESFTLFQLSAYIEAEVLAQKQDYDTSTTPTTFTQAYLQEIEKSRSAPHSYYRLVCFY
jgi:hypothetical protein